MTDIEKVEMKVDEGKILHHYGFIPQVQHLKQELEELMEAADGYVNGIDTEAHFLEEIADVEVMCDQMKLCLDAWDRVNEIKREKVNRQLRRIEDELRQGTSKD